MEPLLEVRGLVKSYPLGTDLFGRARGWARAVDGVDLDLAGGTTLALVGESGCGKTTTARCIVRLIEPDRGSIRFDGVELTSLRGAPLRRKRREFQLVFQDASAALDPRMRVADLVAEPLDIHRLGSRHERRVRAAELLATVGLDQAFLNRYPGELSGGQRQRVGIARALALQPRLVVADEPVSALDVSVQAQVLRLLRDLQDRLGLALLLIAHDLGVVQRLAHAIAVMYLGRIVEQAPAADLFRRPRHPFTRALLLAAPRPDPTDREQRRAARARIQGEPPSPSQIPGGCAFHPRCPRAEARCRIEDPGLHEEGAGHWVACHFPEP
jgi:oligopeptide/dipeptide ABC transporter ATP-binding protein